MIYIFFDFCFFCESGVRPSGGGGSGNLVLDNSIDGFLVFDFRFAIAWSTAYDNMLLRSSVSYWFGLLFVHFRQRQIRINGQ